LQRLLFVEHVISPEAHRGTGLTPVTLANALDHLPVVCAV
jgi:hypothetical protein